jgi:formylglycine-generating enzyme required for sulfatase activity
MRRWFLSYHSPDGALAERLKAAIERKDACSRVFFATTSLRAGGYWQPALATEIDEADAFVLLVGEKGLGPLQALEYYAAHDKHVKSPEFPVILMLLDRQAAPGLPFLRQLRWIVSADPASEKDVARLVDAAAGAGVQPGELWRYTSPYRGLSAMEEKDADYFFSRGRETVEVINALTGAPDKLPVLLGNSGVGKSSLAHAGVLAALKRQAWPEGAGATAEWPHALKDSRHWCFLTLRPGAEPLKALVEAFLETWQFETVNSARIRQRDEWVELLLHDRQTNLSELLDETERRQKELTQSKPPGFFLYLDQGEELYVRAEPRQRRRFSEIIAQGLRDPRLRALMSIRSDFLGALQGDEPLFDVRRQIDVPPLREAQLREVVSRPAALLSARFETDALAADIAHFTAEESAKDAGALPLLSYLLDAMWTQMVKRGDGMLHMPAEAIELGGVLAQRANAVLARHPESELALRRLLTLKLATVHEDGVPTRRRASRSEFTDEEWRLVSELADHRNRLLVAATTEGGETYAEVAHEAIFWRWDKLREWVAGEREFLAWRSGLEVARRAWQATPEVSKMDALLMGAALMRAQSWHARHTENLPRLDREFIAQSMKREKEARRRARRIRVLTYVLLVGIIIGLVAWINQSYVKEQADWWARAWPYALRAEAERALKPLASFRECAKDCPEMIVIPVGEFTMESPATADERFDGQVPQRKVTIARRFAVSRFDVTFADWDACVSSGACRTVFDGGFGRGTRPVINVDWDEAQQYVAWFSWMTGQRYRLLTEAEWEYAARAGTTTAYWWGEEIGEGNANCNGCGGEWMNRGPSPVDAFKPNPFGLYDMHGNVWQWVEDCYDIYSAAPTDGCARHVIRGGSWGNHPQYIRWGNRAGFSTVGRNDYLGFRVARTLTP